MNQQAGLIELAEEKLIMLRKALIMECDAARKFQLQHEIAEAEKQLLDLKVQYGDKNPAANMQITGNKINGDNNHLVININKTKRSIYQWQWWLAGLVGGLLLIALIIFARNDYQANDCAFNAGAISGSTLILNCNPEEKKP